MIAVQAAELARVFGDGQLSAESRQRLQHGLDPEAARLHHDPH